MSRISDVVEEYGIDNILIQMGSTPIREFDYCEFSCIHYSPTWENRHLKSVHNDVVEIAECITDNGEFSRQSFPVSCFDRMWQSGDIKVFVNRSLNGVEYLTGISF